jgi:glycosyltransferase involved in cell wall biosynthesis
MPAIHQILAGYTHGDAISNEARLFQQIFRSWGYASQLVCESRRILPELREEVTDVREFAATCKPDDVVLLHLSIGSIANRIFKTLPCRKVILYHNVTPARFFAMVNPQIASTLAQGARDVADLAGVADLVLADSNYNASELTALGYGDHVRVLPLVLDFTQLEGEYDPRVVRRFRDGCTNILFVGRCAPNKRIDDLVETFAHYHKTVNPNSRLIHAGSFAGVERYHYAIRNRVHELGLDHAVHFAGAVPQAELNAYYELADCFLCMSEHEGFCIPLIEAMVRHLPIVAFDAAAVPETLDGSGVLFRRKHAPSVAEMIHEVTTHAELRKGIIAGQDARLAAFRNRDLTAELRDHLAPVLNGHGSSEAQASV